MTPRARYREAAPAEVALAGLELKLPEAIILRDALEADKEKVKEGLRAFYDAERNDSTTDDAIELVIEKALEEDIEEDNDPYDDLLAKFTITRQPWPRE